MYTHQGGVTPLHGAKVALILPAGYNGDSTLFQGLFLLGLPVSMRDHLASDFGISAEEIGERLQSFGDCRKESSIKIDETQKLLKLLDVPQRREILNS